MKGLTRLHVKGLLSNVYIRHLAKVEASIVWIKGRKVQETLALMTFQLVMQRQTRTLYGILELHLYSLDMLAVGC